MDQLELKKGEFLRNALQIFNSQVSKKSEKFMIGLAGVSFTFHVAGEGLKEMIQQSLYSNPILPVGSPFNIFVWDSSSTNSTPLQAMASIESFTSFGQISGWNKGRYLASFEADACALSLFDCQDRVGIYWILDSKKLPQYVTATPLRSIFQWAFRTIGSELLHAAGIGDESGAVLVVGPGGSGKSNTALTGLANNLNYFGDDYCVISNDYKVHKLYSTTKIYPSDIPFFSENIRTLLKESIEQSNKIQNNDKLVVNIPLAEQWSNHFSAPIKAIIFQKITSIEHSTLSRCTGKDVFLAIAENTSALLPYADARAISNIATFVRSTPCYRLNVGRDGRGRVIDIIKGVLIDSEGEERCQPQ